MKDKFRELINNCNIYTHFDSLDDMYARIYAMMLLDYYENIAKRVMI